MAMRSILARVMLCGAAVAGCGDIVNDVLPLGICNVASASTCIDYTGDTWRTPGAGQMACNAVGMGAVYGTGACSTANRVGTCRVMPGSGQEARTRYYSPRWNVTTATQACAALGGQYSNGG